MPKNFAALTSFKSKTDWVSCRAEDWTVGYCEQVLMQRACAENALGMVQFAWQGAAMQLDHDVVVRRTSGASGGWMMPMGQVGIVVIMWPVIEKKLPGARGATYFSLKLDIDFADPRPLFQCVWDLDEWKARRVCWRSPAWQAASFTAASSKSALKPWGIKAFAVGPEEKFMEAAAASGFWRLGKSFLQRLAAHRGLELPGEDGLFQTAEKLAKHTTKKSDQEILAYMGKRLSIEAGGASTSIQDFLGMEDAMMCVTRQEAEELQRVANSAASLAVDASAFKSSFKQRHSAVQAARSKNRGGGAKGGEGSASSASSPRALPVGDLSQAQLKPLAPPGGSIWMGHRSGCWQSHFPPFRRVGRSWHLYGHRRAAVLALQDCWEKALVWEGKDTSACPIIGLFAENAEEHALPAGSSGAASSSAAPA